MDRRRFLTGVGAVGLGAAGLGALAACSDDDPPTPSPSATTPSATSSETPSPSPTSTAVAPKVAGEVADGLNVPWGIAFLPGGDALVSQRDSHEIARVSPSGQVSTIGSVGGVVSTEGGERGLLGIALDPDDAGHLYAYVSTASDNRVLRFDFDGKRLSGRRTILAGIPVGQHHNGGRLLFGPGDSLFVSTGESGTPALAQDRSSLGGKILRIRRDGRAAAGNPFGNRVWTYGHRNVEGLALDADGRLWASEFGDKQADELNVIRRGRNYGWPDVEGRSDDPAYADPATTWGTDECSPAGIAITRSHAFVAALRGRCLWVVPLRGADAGRPRRLLHEQHGRLRSVAVTPTGELWVTTSNTDGRGTPERSDDVILRLTL